ncbi:MAG TPA: hypothetical protein VMU46_13820 [Burkholderiales bacterium]|nr:hypothetical protein [Burkholderiales bacterium]
MRNERRLWLRVAAAAIALQMAWLRSALAAGSVQKGVHRLRGDVRVNGEPAKEGMDVNAGDVVTTGAASEVLFVTGKDAFLVRPNSRIEAQGAAGALVLAGLRVVTGAVLSVFSPGERKTLRTPTATIGIRGTAVYLEAEEARTYVCTCYGEADIVSAMDPSARETVRTRHHEQPRYVMGMGAPQMLMSAPVVNHTDAELIMLEGLTGRRPPFLDMPGYQPGRY